MKKISIKTGIIIILAAAGVLFGSIYFVMQAKNTKSQADSANVQNETMRKTYLMQFKFESEHIKMNNIKVKVNTDEFSPGYDKEFIWPEVKNIADKNVLAKVENILNFKDNTGYVFDVKELSHRWGLTGTWYNINYDKNNILSISIFTSHMGAYPSGNIVNHSINLLSGEEIKPADIFYENRMSNLVALLNVELQSNLQENLDLAKKENRLDGSGQCSETEIKDLLSDPSRDDSKYDQNFHKFIKEKLDFKITEGGVEFIYHFGFAHAFQACQPDGTVVLSYDQLKEYIDPSGLLGNKIK